VTALATAVQARVATRRLAQLTRPNDDTASTVDTTYLELAVTDVVAAFETYAMEVFDDTVPRHLALGVMGVVAVLRSWKGSDDEDKQLTAWYESLAAMAKTRSRARVLATSSRTATDSPETSSRPVFDRTRFQDMDVIGPPADDDARVAHDDLP
jgi:hypothetical protein